MIKALKLISPRIAFLGTFALCAGLIGFGLVLQHVEGIEPCPLCILQRYGFVVCGLIGLIAGLHNPTGFMRRAYGALLALAAIAGGSVSIRQVWLQHNPPANIVCGPDLAYMVNRFPVSELLPKLFHGDGDCSKVDWTFLHLSIAEWALICFAGILVVAAWQMLRRWPAWRRFF